MTVEWDASEDDVGVAGYRVYSDGAFAGMVEGHSTTFTVMMFPEEESELTVLASDARNNESDFSNAVTLSSC